MRHDRNINIYFPLPQIRVRMNGDWVKVTKAMTNLSSSIQRGYDKAVSKYSNKLLQIIKRAIQEGEAPGSVVWEPHSRKTRASYKAHGYVVDHPYLRTGLFYRSLGMYSYKGRSYIGLKGNYRTKEGLTLVQLAKVLEYGNEKIPARPLFAPALEEVGGTKRLESEIMKCIRSELGHLGFRPNQIKTV